MMGPAFQDSSPSQTLPKGKRSICAMLKAPKLWAMVVALKRILAKLSKIPGLILTNPK